MSLCTCPAGDTGDSISVGLTGDMFDAGFDASVALGGVAGVVEISLSFGPSSSPGSFLIGVTGEGALSSPRTLSNAEPKNELAASPLGLGASSFAAPSPLNVDPRANPPGPSPDSPLGVSAAFASAFGAWSSASTISEVIEGSCAFGTSGAPNARNDRCAGVLLDEGVPNIDLPLSTVEPPVPESIVTVDPKLGSGVLPKLGTGVAFEDPRVANGEAPACGFWAILANGDAATVLLPPKVANGDAAAVLLPAILAKGDAAAVLLPKLENGVEAGAGAPNGGAGFANVLLSLCFRGEPHGEVLLPRPPEPPKVLPAAAPSGVVDPNAGFPSALLPV